MSSFENCTGTIPFLMLRSAIEQALRTSSSAPARIKISFWSLADCWSQPKIVSMRWRHFSGPSGSSCRSGRSNRSPRSRLQSNRATAPAPSLAHTPGTLRGASRGPLQTWGRSGFPRDRSAENDDRPQPFQTYCMQHAGTSSRPLLFFDVHF